MESLWRIDQGVFRTINLNWHSAWLDPFFFVISSTGLGWVQASVIALCLLYKVRSGRGSFLKNLSTYVRKPVTETILLAAWLTTGILDLLIKQLVPRERPSDLSWSLPQEQISWHSFASGHTASAFGIAFTYFFLTRGTRQSGFGWLALGWAGLVGFSRVYRGVHWPSDVLSGFFVGLGCACLTMLFGLGQPVDSTAQG